MLKFLLPAAMTLGLATSVAAQDRSAPIDAASHYSGVWLEVGRTPMGLTNGCVAGTTRYEMKDATHVAVEDDCRQGSPSGKRRAIRGKGVIEDAPVNRRLKVNYAPFITWRYDVLDRDPAGAWFIAADPKLKKVFLYTRAKPTQGLLDQLAAKARGLGYTGEIEFPAVD
ncbi:lipocalin family protein [Caulobacter sp. FWC2]|uniref:lipocalin family protein n=1 Tax=Caulobacter sp. FWC2 TaxID=69664 RepID=UPI000C1453D0|nr:lipocalin family protein [Caulobacter sp. FWC2]PIB90818.1 hypothetical protein CSW62_04095 [Caulobacter sp. FWC2]